MKLFSCDQCGFPVHFDNRFCVNCKSRLGFVAEDVLVRALVPIADTDWEIVGDTPRKFRFCANAGIDICNWTVPSEETEPFCQSCRHNRLVPNASTPEGLELWSRISQAQRHLFYSLLRWRVPLQTREEAPQDGLVFDLLVDEVNPDGSVTPAMTGHEEGLIAIRVAEADDVTREKARTEMNEKYRTLLGHFRHEVGHYIWNRLVRDRNDFESCRAVFGDEREDYPEALRRNYEEGPPPGWQQNFISTYATSHPWEDFAECFAHYLHIVDTLETARAFGMAVEPEGHEDMTMEVAFDPYRARNAQQLVSAWVPLSVALNSINRSLGQPDLYPFVLTPAVVTKLQYIHGLMQRASQA